MSFITSSTLRHYTNIFHVTTNQQIHNAEIKAYHEVTTVSILLKMYN